MNRVLDELEISSSILFKWLQLNYMKANTDKSHILLSGKNKLAANIDTKYVGGNYRKLRYC